MKPNPVQIPPKKEFTGQDHEVKRVCPTGEKQIQLAEQRLKKRAYPQLTSKARFSDSGKRVKLLTQRKSLFLDVFSNNYVRYFLIIIMFLVFCFVVYQRFFTALSVAK